MDKLIEKIREGHMSTVAMELLQPNNTVTTLEIKLELRRRWPAFSWTQRQVSDFMNQMHLAGNVTYQDNGTFRIYSGEVKKTKSSKKDPKTGKPMKKVKAKSISKTKAFDLIMANKGYFFTAEFVKKDGEVRVMNCQVLKDQDPKLGYIKVKEAALMRSNPDQAIRQINIQTLKSLKIGGVAYKVK